MCINLPITDEVFFNLFCEYLAETKAVMKIKTPLALFVYNRPEHTKCMLASLENCQRLDECQVYFYSDGARALEQSDDVEAVREIVCIWGGQHDARIIERSENLGLAQSIVRGVTELCREYGRVIVIEDDLVLHPQFLNYMLHALDRYKNDERVAQISGYMFPEHHAKKPDALFLPYITTWGWATWSRAWQLFKWHPDIRALEQPSLSKRFDLNYAYPFTSMLRGQVSGQVQSWGILFYWGVFSANKLVLHPRLSLVKNEGFDGTGVHFRTPGGEQHQQPPFQTEWPNLENDFVWPESIQVNSRALKTHQRYLRSQISLRSRIKNRLLRWLKLASRN